MEPEVAPEVPATDALPADTSVDTPVAEVVAEPVAEVAPKADTVPVVAAPVDDKKFLDMLAEMLAEEVADGKNPEELKGLVGREELAKLQGAPRAVLRHAMAEFAAERTASAAKTKADADANTAEKARIATAGQELRRREAALHSLANSPELDAARRGVAPKVDPLTPEGAAALAEFHALKGVAAALAPMHQRGVDAQKRLAVDELRASYPELKDDASWSAFGSWLAKENEGIDVTKGQAPRVNAVLGARLYAAEVRQVEAKRVAESLRTTDHAARTEAVRSIGKSTTGAAGSRDEDIPDDVWNSGQSVTYLASLSPERKRAIYERLRAS